MIISEFLPKLGALQDEARRQFPDCVGVRFTLRDSTENLFLIGNGGWFNTNLLIQEAYPKDKSKEIDLHSDYGINFDGETLSFDDQSFRLEVAVTFPTAKFTK